MGEGSLKYPDGSKYCGGFVNGRRQGLGMHKDASGEVYLGQWEDDARVE